VRPKSSNKQTAKQREQNNIQFQSKMVTIGSQKD